jgi:hypothetical protein
MPDCKKCRTPMIESHGLLQTFVGGELDFPSDPAPVTFSAGGPGKLAQCWKCPDCGWSMTKYIALSPVSVPKPGA